MALKREALLEDIRELFTPAIRPADRSARTIGAELEFIPRLSSTGERVLAADGDPSGDYMMRRVAEKFKWKEEKAGADPSGWSFPDGRVSFEPGGQIELSSRPFDSANSLLESMQRWIAVIRDQAKTNGVELGSSGIEPRVPFDRVPLQLHRDRYEKMTRYFDSIGPFGAVMMRQTASFQVNMDRGPDPVARWRLLNALAPYLVAIFSNSPRYAGIDTSHKSYRANVWRLLDSQRTGIRYDSADPAECYLQFALDAPMILGNRVNHFPTLRVAMNEGRVTPELWNNHLSTLFPEIRPRDYFEIRSMDTIEPNFLAAPLVLICGLVYDDTTASSVLEILGDPDAELLVRAGKSGMADAKLAESARELVLQALRGCRSLGESYISAGNIKQAETYFEEYTLVGRSPADDYVD